MDQAFRLVIALEYKIAGMAYINDVHLCIVRTHKERIESQT